MLFVYFQFKGFGEIIDQGYYFTGAESSITTSFLYVLILLHLVHLFSGLIVLIVVFYKLQKRRYSGSNTLGFELAHLFWHFLGLLWIYLYLFIILFIHAFTWHGFMAFLSLFIYMYIILFIYAFTWHGFMAFLGWLTELCTPPCGGEY